MAREIDYFFTPVSPWAYFGHQRFFEIARRAGAKVHIKPCDYGRIFPASGGLPVKQRSKQRLAYREAELKRWRDYLRVPLNIHPKHFPVPDALASCAVIAAGRAGQDAAQLAFALGRATWAEERDISDPATIREVADACGFDGKQLAEAAAGPDAKAVFDANTEEAIDRQVFGAPAYIFNGELFWGQDRVDFLERALQRDQKG